MKTLKFAALCSLLAALLSPKASAQVRADWAQALQEAQSAEAAEPMPGHADEAPSSASAQLAKGPGAPSSAPKASPAPASQPPSSSGLLTPNFQAPSGLPPMPCPASSAEQQELMKISAENQIADQKLKRKLQKLIEDKEELRAQYELIQQKQRNLAAELEGALNKAGMENRLEEERRKAENAKMEAEIQKLSTQNRLAEERAKAEIAKLNEDIQKAGAENKLSAELGKKALDELSRLLEKARIENDVKNEQLRELQIANDKEKRAIDMELKRIELEEKRLQFDKLVMDSRMSKLKSDLDLRDKKDEWKKEANTEPAYLDKPFKDGRLVISDRRISLNGPIWTGVADYVTERIHYFNNISSTQPIFIVIDRSPGGSVMEGYRIVKAMQASKAKVHVVVKSFAASMAAVIATMADQSYAYPNAIILHHQMSTFNWGNMTQLKEQLELAKEWERRLHVPVAQKMGVSIEEFRKKMYEKSSDGDWQEFGDKAVSYKWVGSVVHEIEETGFTKNPDVFEKRKGPSFLDEKTDEKGQRFVTLPRLEPFDFYFIYNPDRYYR
ncbi:MAG: ATP-dependent Clp protease proteolytic subunit [Elusimicrobia bacterium]|nr:ATP-dependent Clp protease proteolytic subunit [Elusimicrobiota bacterium]